MFPKSSIEFFEILGQSLTCSFLLIRNKVHDDDRKIIRGLFVLIVQYQVGGTLATSKNPNLPSSYYSDKDIFLKTSLFFFFLKDRRESSLNWVMRPPRGVPHLSH